MERLNALPKANHLHQLDNSNNNNNNNYSFGTVVKAESDRTSFSGAKISEDAMAPMNSAAQPFASQTDTSGKPIPSAEYASRDTFVVLLTLTIISITLYFSYYLWKKHRHREICDSSKLVECRYSRLSQNEVDVDNVQFTDPLYPPEDNLICDTEPECDEILTPATLQLEPLTTISDKDSLEMGKRQYRNSANEQTNASSLLLDNLSDEDLLQG